MKNQNLLVCTLISTSWFLLSSCSSVTDISILTDDDSTLFPSTTFRQPVEEEEQPQEVTQNNDYNTEDSTTLVLTSDNSGLEETEPLSETKIRATTMNYSTISVNTTSKTKDTKDKVIEKRKEEKELTVSQVPTENLENPTRISSSTASAASLQTLTQRQEEVVKELNDIWNYSASLNDTTHKELKTTLSSVVQLAYARVATEPDDTLDRLMYLLQKLRQRIGVSDESPPERDQQYGNVSISSQGAADRDRDLNDSYSQSSRRINATDAESTGSATAPSSRRKRSYGLGTGIGEIESVPITSHENSIVSNYNNNHDWFNAINHNINNNNKNAGVGSSSSTYTVNVVNPDSSNSDNWSYNYDDDEDDGAGTVPSVTPSEKTIHKVILVQDQGASPVTFVSNEPTKRKSPFFYLKSTTLTPLKPTTKAPNFYPPIKLSYLNKIQMEYQNQQQNQKKRPRPHPQHHHMQAATTSTTQTSIQYHNNNNNNHNKKNKNKYKVPVTVGIPESETLGNVMSSNQETESVSVNQIANAIVKLLYPAIHGQSAQSTTPVNVNPFFDLESHEDPYEDQLEPDNSTLNLKDKMQLLLTLTAAPVAASGSGSGPGKPNPQKVSLASLMQHLTTTTKPDLFPTYLQIHPLPSLTQLSPHNHSDSIRIKYPPVLQNLINSLKYNQSFGGANTVPLDTDAHIYLEVPTQLPPQEQEVEFAVEDHQKVNVDLKTGSTTDTIPVTTTAEDRIDTKASSEAPILSTTRNSVPSIADLFDMSSTVRSLNLTFPPIMINNNSYTYYYPAPPPQPTTTTTTTEAPTRMTTTMPFQQVTFPTLMPNMTVSNSQMMQIMHELQQVNLMQGPAHMLNGTREGIVQLIATLSTLSFATKIVMVFALSIAVLSIILGVYSVAPPIVAVGILGIMIPIAIILLLQESSHKRRYRNPHGKIGITDLRDEFLITIELIEKALEKFKRLNRIKKKKEWQKWQRIYY